GLGWEIDCRFAGPNCSGQIPAWASVAKPRSNTISRKDPKPAKISRKDLKETWGRHRAGEPASERALFFPAGKAGKDAGSPPRWRPHVFTSEFWLREEVV